MSQNASPPDPSGAVVSFVAGRFKFSAQVFTDCLRDLAGEEVVRFDVDGHGLPVVGLNSGQPRSGRTLAQYERLALERVRMRARGGSTAPLAALVSDDGDDYRSWRSRFTSALETEVRRAGLGELSVGKVGRRVISIVITFALVVFVGYLIDDHSVLRHIAGPALIAAMFTPFAALFARRWRPTPSGTAVIDRRRRGSAVAGDVARAPLSPGHVWSSHGGQWHSVRVGRELLLRAPHRRQFALFATWFALLGIWEAIVAAVKFKSAVGDLIQLGVAAAGLFATAGLARVVIWIPDELRRRGLPDDAIFVGQVVKTWHQRTDDDSGRYFVSIDDGSSASRTFKVGKTTYHGLVAGDTVQVRWNPRQGSLQNIQLVP